MFDRERFDLHGGPLELRNRLNCSDTTIWLSPNWQDYIRLLEGEADTRLQNMQQSTMVAMLSPLPLS